MARNDQKGSMTARNRRVTDPYDRWCGGRELKPPAYPIRFLRLQWWRVEVRYFRSLVGRMPSMMLEPSQCDSFVVVVELDLGEHEQQMHLIKLPVDLSEYPDVLRSRCLGVRLEMGGHEGNSHTMRCVRLHAGRDRLYSPSPCNFGRPAYRKSDVRSNGCSPHTKHEPSRPSQGT
jgi:hypothetical protein